MPPQAFDCGEIVSGPQVMKKRRMLQERHHEKTQSILTEDHLFRLLRTYCPCNHQPSSYSNSVQTCRDATETYFSSTVNQPWQQGIDRICSLQSDPSAENLECTVHECVFQKNMHIQFQLMAFTCFSFVLKCHFPKYVVCLCPGPVLCRDKLYWAKYGNWKMLK